MTRLRRRVGPSTRTGTDSCWVMEGRWSYWRVWSMRSGAGLTSSARCWATAPRPMPTTSRRRRIMVQVRSRPCEAVWQDGNIDLKDVGYINAHGTSTPQGDMAETEAVKAVFGDQARKLIFGSTKSMTGHLLGGAGALEFAVALLSATCGVIPPDDQSVHPRPKLRSGLGSQPQSRAQGRRRAIELLRVRRSQRYPGGTAVGELRVRSSQGRLRSQPLREVHVPIHLRHVQPQPLQSPT